jgi:phosphoglycerate kinase
MKSIREAGDLNGKRVFVRVDWNVIKNGKVSDEYRIKASLPTLEFLRSASASVLIATHLEDVEPGAIELLRPYVPEGMTLLPNLRDNPGEKGNSEDFARELAAQADVYVNEAFSASHRAHASIVLVPKLLPSYAGLRFIEEFNQLSKTFNPPHPFLLLLGGAKIETKLPLVEKFAKIADTIFVGGAMAVKAAELGLQENYGVMFPTGDLAALDANEETLRRLKAKIAEARFVVWNGPLGKYEAGYTKYTNELAHALAAARGEGTEVVIGGGDTLAAIQSLNILDQFAFVSTAGGAMLDFLATGSLPGIQALD